MERHLLDLAERNAGELGIGRREFLRSVCGMALRSQPMNQIFGGFFKVEAAEMMEASSAAERKVDFFIFDVQTHHVAVDRYRFSSMNFLDLRRGGQTDNHPRADR